MCIVINFFDTQQQQFLSVGTAQVVKLNTDAGSFGCHLENDGKIVISNPGTYTFIYSIQLKIHKTIRKNLD
mgnify:CR=1 FL=1